MNTILVVAENNDTVQVRCELVREVLSAGGSRTVQVLPACSVDGVLDILAKGPIDMLIVEDRMTAITGTGLIRWLDTLLIGTTRILLTSDPLVLAEPWKFAGPDVNEVLPKPLERESLTRALHRWFGQPTAFVATPGASFAHGATWVVSRGDASTRSSA
jgi:CheY-like chemotaxis protein